MFNKDEIQIQFVPIELLEYNNGQIPGVPENPRTREDEKQRNLEKSIEELPEMTIARAALCFPYNGRYVVIGGNRRLEAQRALKRKKVPIIALPENTPVEKLRRMALLDNESTGQTDWTKLAKEWNKDEIREWKIETPKGWFNEIPGKKEKYSQKIVSPIYEVKGIVPDIKTIIDMKKVNSLLHDIENAKIAKEVKDMLKICAYRHAVIDFSKMAEYYAQADKQVQRLMEDNGLVIIDYNRAVENGFVEIVGSIKDIEYEK